MDLTPSILLEDNFDVFMLNRSMLAADSLCMVCSHPGTKIPAEIGNKNGVKYTGNIGVEATKYGSIRELN